MIFLRAWILMLVLGMVYSWTGWHWQRADGHLVILALGYWWCLLIVFIISLVVD